MDVLVIFIFGAVCTAVLVKLSDWKLNYVSIIGASLAFIGFSYISLVPDWRVVAANTVSFLVLFFAPVLAVLMVKNLSVPPVRQKLLAILAGGISTVLFQYAGFGVAYVLGV
jgi:hypothetical protein